MLTRVVVESGSMSRLVECIVVAGLEIEALF